MASGRPHAPVSICGAAVSYDANGNTTSYDADGAGPVLPRSLIHDGKNRPIAVTQNGNVATFAHGPDGERAQKSFLGETIHFLGNDAELRLPAGSSAAIWTSHLHPDVKREGATTSWGHKDHLGSNRRTSFMGATAIAIHAGLPVRV